MSTKLAYKSNRNIYYSCKYHVVWCPKYRRKVLVEAVAERLAIIIREVCQKHQAEVLSLEIMPDHVHALVEVDPQFGIHRLVKLMKGRSSRLLRQDFLHKASHALVNSYGLIVFEKLQPANMSKRPKPKPDEQGNYMPNGAAAKGGLNKSIVDAGWAMFQQFCTYKAILTCMRTSCMLHS